MADFLMGLPLFCLVLTVGSFQIGLWCQKKTGTVLCNPILIGAALVGAVLLLLRIDPAAYQSGASGLSWLLTPATVCLAVPLHRQLKVLKKSLSSVIVGVIAGTAVSLLSILLLCLLWRLNRQLTVSLLPKSITAAMGMVLSEQNGGISALTSVVILITGILGNLAGPFLCRVLKLTDPISQGVAYGTASHIIGTARASEIGPLAGAVSSLSLVVAGILTAIVFPLLCTLL
ncbi:MAG: LrgB family protein [Oscillospiraceae bacterium]|nr:LrgB family protein [Oscillospiraceae bacterium]